MSRDPYGYGYGYGGRGGQRWDSERFNMERDRVRYGGERDTFQEREVIRDTIVPRGGVYGGPPRPRERSFDEVHERSGPRGGYEEDRIRERVYYDDAPRYEREREPVRERTTIEKEREYYNPSPPLRSPNRPGFLRRQSSLDTFDRRPLTKYVERREEETYDPRVGEFVPIPPLPRARALPPPRRYVERDYEEIKIAEPDYYGDDDYRPYPERVKEREIIRTRRRSRSRVRSEKSSKSVRSSSSSSTSSKEIETLKSEFPKKGKTRMPARLVSKKALIDLDYPFEEEGDIIIIQKALGRENIDEVIKLSEDYKSSERTIIEEHKEVYTVPALPPPPPGWVPMPPPQHTEIITETKTTEHGPIIINAGRPHEEVIERKTEIIEHSDPMPHGALALALPAERSERAIRAEIRALEAEKEALRAERRADRRLRKTERLRSEGRSSDGDLVLYEDRVYRGGDEVTLVRREKIVEPEGGVRIEKDRKGPPPKLVRAMLATLT